MASIEMASVTAPGARPAPHPLYKQDLLDLIDQLAPGSLLDVGCGEGELLRAAARDGRRCAGLEITPQAVSAGQAAGLELHLGRAEALPFADAGFDVVVLDYVAHHVEDLERGLREAARVAASAIVVLDPWYDLSIPSQRVAHDYDLWAKRLDRRQGLVHNPPISAHRLARACAADVQIDCRHRLVLQPIDPATLETQARQKLAAAGGGRVAEDALEALLDRARLDGVSHDGAILFAATRA